MVAGIPPVQDLAPQDTAPAAAGGGDVGSVAKLDEKSPPNVNSDIHHDDIHSPSSYPERSPLPSYTNWKCNIPNLMPNLVFKLTCKHWSCLGAGGFLC